jgi:tetratricopeptide (TPR) repeat protein
MSSHLVDIERRALEARKAGDIREAARLFATIVKEESDWDHGSATYNLACCYEDLGKLALAEQYFREALKYEPENSIFLVGSLRFFTCTAIQLRPLTVTSPLRKVHRKNGDRRGAESTRIALGALGKGLGLSDEALAEKLR